jgi:hypothetical protein
MNPFVKLLIGLMLVLSGVSWYIFNKAFIPYFGVTSLKALGIVFIGSFGIFLLILGLIVVWVEIEEIRDLFSNRKKKEDKTKKHSKK